MTLPSSGPLSMSDINTEFGRGNDLNSYRGTTWYTDAGGSGTFPTGAISISDFYSKRATAPSSYVNPLGFNGGSYSDTQADGFASIFVSIRTDGTWLIQDSTGAGQASGNWRTPTSAGIGTGKYVKFTLNSTSGSSTGTSWTTTTAWLEITSNRNATVSATAPSTPSTRTRTANYTVQVATDSGGTNIVSSGTVTLIASASL